MNCVDKRLNNFREKEENEFWADFSDSDAGASTLKMCVSGIKFKSIMFYFKKDQHTAMFWLPSNFTKFQHFACEEKLLI